MSDGMYYAEQCEVSTHSGERCKARRVEVVEHATRKPPVTLKVCWRHYLRLRSRGWKRLGPTQPQRVRAGLEALGVDAVDALRRGAGVGGTDA